MGRLQLITRDRYVPFTGWGQINAGLAPLADERWPGDRDVHLYVGLPADIPPRDPAAVNVFLTMTDYADPRRHSADFVDVCNEMDMVLATGERQGFLFRGAGITATIIPVVLGNDHAKWRRDPVPAGHSRALLLDRGRDNDGSMGIIGLYFDEVTALSNIGDEQQYTEEELLQEFHKADVFFKWGVEVWSFPVLQAMSAGCLIVTDSHLPYLVHGQNCLIFDDPDQLRAGLVTASTKPCLELKRAGQMTAAALTWPAARETIRGHILGLIKE